MWAEVDGERKKVACGPCIRGHRSSKCDHRDRVLVEVRKPGRPLSSCPHPSGSCSCERVVINYTIPKSSECACPSERAQHTATVAGNSRIQKNRRKSTIVNSASLEKALRTGQDTETDTSSIAQTPTEGSPSNEASPPSSASSTPRILPAQKEGISSCCKPKSIQAQTPKASCCSSKKQTEPEPTPMKPCCSGSSAPANTARPSPAFHNFGHQLQFQSQPHVPNPQFQHFQPQAPSSTTLPYGLGAPIYNHAAAAYHQQQHRASISMNPIPSHSGAPINQHVPKHNCHCGESCSCFGCAAHPNNATMMEYVRLMAHFQYTGGFGAMSPPLYDMPTYPHHPGFGAEANQTVNYTAMSQAMSTPTPTQMNFPPNMDMPILPSASMPYSAAWQRPPLSATAMHGPQYLEPGNYTLSSPLDNQVSQKVEETVSTPIADSPSDGSREEDTSTLSPSSYFWNQMTLPSCSDATGTCQCGDGCACVGCLTHGGHNGVHLDEPISMAEHDAFPEFAAGSDGLGMNDSTAEFMRFHAAPT
ncbi:hypothetical protein T440DRAFT_59085 [Plenodomus tracheiphilus IPT5]|uniref:Copper-fist domain-containing protein n=1 Tax=Plenodomus tracheiphilus IPT5 TaxID=1408161 RepID=A0A6A7B9D3_9PLEO|nr:hypothetical protein T440DRAFT_59085 [Plenodomus tracheiphilus IPT5]